MFFSNTQLNPLPSGKFKISYELSHDNVQMNNEGKGWIRYGIGKVGEELSMMLSQYPHRVMKQ